MSNPKSGAYHHKSGSVKRKEKKERDDRAVKAARTQATLMDFGIGSQSQVSGDPRPTTKASKTEDMVDQQVQQVNEDLDCPPISESTIEIEEPTCDLVNENLDFPSTSKSTIEKEMEEPTRPQGDSSTNREAVGVRKDFDIGTVETDYLSTEKVREIISHGHQELPSVFPRDRTNIPFPDSLLFRTVKDQKIKRDWLVWSVSKKAFFCLPCRLLSKKIAARSKFCTREGFSCAKVWKKLYDRFPAHENDFDHIHCYTEWRKLERRIRQESTVDCLLTSVIKEESKKWREILHRILHVILFLGERGLAFRGESLRIGDRDNGNFLGILELISRFDPVLEAHLQKVKEAQQAGVRLQVHYLSPEIQNEFIELCGSHVRSRILEERKQAKYYSIMVDATPDSAHIEQTTFIFRYLRFDEEEKKYIVEERFTDFVDCNKKTGEDIAKLICETLEKYNIALDECRGQGYDNGSNMRGQYKGAKAHILKLNPLAVFSPCAAHSLNLCGVDCAESCTQAITFFGTVQKFYTIFSSSPARWDILKRKIKCSLHRLSDTRWSARIDAVRPFATHLAQLPDVLQEICQLNLTPETRSDVEGLKKYISSFKCILMSSIWLKILTAIDEVNKVLQTRAITLDVEVKNLGNLLDHLQILRGNYDIILQECHTVADTMENMESTFPTETLKRQRRRKKFFDEGPSKDSEDTVFNAEQSFKVETFLVIIDSVIAGITERFTEANELCQKFSFLWKFNTMDENAMEVAVKNFMHNEPKYEADVTDDLVNELLHLKHIYSANFQDDEPIPFTLLNDIVRLQLETLFPNIVVALRIFCTLPVTVASAERSFSVLARIKNHLRSCSGQERVTNLGILAIEYELARKCNFDAMIQDFADKKARKANLYS